MHIVYCKRPYKKKLHRFQIKIQKKDFKDMLELTEVNEKISEQTNKPNQKRISESRRHVENFFKMSGRVPG